MAGKPHRKKGMSRDHQVRVIVAGLSGVEREKAILKVLSLAPEDRISLVASRIFVLKSFGLKRILKG